MLGYWDTTQKPLNKCYSNVLLIKFQMQKRVSNGWWNDIMMNEPNLSSHQCQSMFFQIT